MGQTHFSSKKVQILSYCRRTTKAFAIKLGEKPSLITIRAVPKICEQLRK